MFEKLFRRNKRPSDDPYYKAMVEHIKMFRPFRSYSLEVGYQVDLARYLWHVHRGVDLEEQRSSVRPDVIIGDLGIEVKGPTTTQSLETISHKLVRYQLHFKFVIVVLFDVNVEPAHYSDWVKGMRRSFPDVEIINMSAVIGPRNKVN